MQTRKDGARLFASQAFNYQALRTMGHSAAYGANPGECLAAIGSIRKEDGESWYQGWHALGEKCEKMAAAAHDSVSRGKAWLRASNYYRTSEFFLNPTDTRRLAIYRESAEAFVRGVQGLKIPHKIWRIPHERVSMRAYYFPGEEDKPLILVCGGYDSTIEEGFFWVGNAARERGYPCIMFEGPGQSNMIREYGMKFTHEWEKPVKALLDFIEWEAPELAKHKKILAGISMGAVLALRAAAFERGIDAVAGLGGFPSMLNVALAQVPAAGRLLYRLRFKGMLNSLALIKASSDIGRRWALEHGCWTIGADTPFELLEKTASYSIVPVADKITCDVLIVNGEKDHLVPAPQSSQFSRIITRARSYSEHTLKNADGAGEHCQAGATEQFHHVFFEWADRLFR